MPCELMPIMRSFMSRVRSPYHIEMSTWKGSREEGQVKARSARFVLLSKNDERNKQPESRKETH
jgi:hypothetical protein